MRESETKRQSSKFDSRFIPGIWLGRATESDEHIVGTALAVYTAKSALSKNDQAIWNSGLIKSMRGTPWAPRSEDSQAEVHMPAERHKPRILRDLWDEMDKTAGCTACASPGGKKHIVACLGRQEEWKTRTIPQSERMTHGTDTEKQQDTQAAASSSTVHTPMTDIRDTDQPETGNDEF